MNIFVGVVVHCAVVGYNRLNSMLVICCGLLAKCLRVWVRVMVRVRVRVRVRAGVRECT